MTGPARNVSMYFSCSSRQIAAAGPGLSGEPSTSARPRMLPSTREYPSLRMTVSPMNPVYGAGSLPFTAVVSASRHSDATIGFPPVFEKTVRALSGSWTAVPVRANDMGRWYAVSSYENVFVMAGMASFRRSSPRFFASSTSVIPFHPSHHGFLCKIDIPSLYGNGEGRKTSFWDENVFPVTTDIVLTRG